MHLIRKLADEQSEEQRLTFFRFIKLTEKRQLEKMWQVKNRIHMRRQIKQKIDNKIHIIPTALAGGIRGYKPPHTLKSHIESSRFPQQLTPTKRMHSEEVVRKKDQQYRMPNLKLLYRKDELNSIKQKGKFGNVLDEIQDKELKLKHIRLSLPVALNDKPDHLKNRASYNHVSPQSQKNLKFINPERIVKN